MTLFLDSNAHLPLNKKALEAFTSFNNSLAGHGHASSMSAPGRAAKQVIEESRANIAKAIGADSPKQIFFTSSCTQACEWGLEIMNSQGFEKVFTSTIEHKSVAEKSRTLFGNNDLFVSKSGIVSCEYNPGNNRAFVCIHVHNEIGTIQPIEKIQVPFFCDMSQTLGKVPINVSSLPNLKVAVFGAHKFGGPVGVGFMYLRDPKWWREFGTGSRYFFDRPGTPDAGMIYATAVALEEASKTVRDRYERALMFRSILEKAVQEMGFEIIGESASRVPHVTFIQIGHRMASHVIHQLEAEGMYIGRGSACGSICSSSNPVMTALGYGGHSEDYIRISQWGNYGPKEAKELIRCLQKYCPRVDI